MDNMPEHKTFTDVDVKGSLNGSSHSSDLDELSLSAFGAGLKRIFLPGGQILFRENEVADSLYIASGNSRHQNVSASSSAATMATMRFATPNY